jgi:hypothetical protein
MKYNLLLLILSVIFFTSCEKVIVVKLDEGTSQLAIDAFLNNKQGSQKIRLTKTSGYFNNAPSPAATGASVKITDNEGRVYNFTDVNNSGDYIWTPSAGDTLVRYFNSYTLSVIYSGEEFQGNSIAYPSPVIDSVRYATKQESGGGGSTAGEQGYFASFYAYDISGMTNFYWIKTYKNGVFYSNPGNMNLSQDGAYAGGGSDGFLFILPIREAITPGDKPLVIGDSVDVDIYAITPETFFYLNEVVQQTTNGGLFATPPANVSCNIKNVNPNSSTKAVGWFNVGALSSNGIKVK